MFPKNEKISLRDGIYSSMMLGFGDQYLTIFAVFLGASTVEIGLLTSLPLFVCAVTQILALKGLKFTTSRKSLISKAVFFQSAVWLAIAALCIVNSLILNNPTILWLTALVVLYQGITGFINPIWSSLIGDLVSSGKRGEFIGKRNQLNGITTFLAMLCAGGLLEAFKVVSFPIYGFFVIFLLAGIARFGSLLWVRRHDDPVYVDSQASYFSFWQFISRTKKSNFAKFVFFFSLISMGAQISGPFFSAHMMNYLGYSFIDVTIIQAIAVLSQCLTTRSWGIIADKYGNKSILDFCSWGLCLNPLFWLVSNNFYFLIGLQIFAGFMWAGFFLASANFLFDAVTPQKRARCAAYQGFISGIFILAGSLLGAYFSRHVYEVFSYLNISWEPFSPFLAVFLLSGIVRFLACLLLLNRFKEVRIVQETKSKIDEFMKIHLHQLGGFLK